MNFQQFVLMLKQHPYLFSQKNHPQSTYPSQFSGLLDLSSPVMRKTMQFASQSVNLQNGTHTHMCVCTHTHTRTRTRTHTHSGIVVEKTVNIEKVTLSGAHKPSAKKLYKTIENTAFLYVKYHWQMSQDHRM